MSILGPAAGTALPAASYPPPALSQSELGKAAASAHTITPEKACSSNGPSLLP